MWSALTQAAKPSPPELWSQISAQGEPTAAPTSLPSTWVGPPSPAWPSPGGMGSFGTLDYTTSCTRGCHVSTPGRTSPSRWTRGPPLTGSPSLSSIKEGLGMWEVCLFEWPVAITGSRCNTTGEQVICWSVTQGSHSRGPMTSGSLPGWMATRRLHGEPSRSTSNLGLFTTPMCRCGIRFRMSGSVTSKSEACLSERMWWFWSVAKLSLCVTWVGVSCYLYHRIIVRWRLSPMSQPPLGLWLRASGFCTNGCIIPERRLHMIRCVFLDRRSASVLQLVICYITSNIIVCLFLWDAWKASRQAYQASMHFVFMEVLHSVFCVVMEHIIF